MDRLALSRTGFFEDDAKILQKALNEEFERNRMELVRKKVVEMREEERAEEERRQREHAARLAQEEEDLLAREPGTVYTLGLVQRNATPRDLSLRVNAVGCRILLRALQANTSVQSLDLADNGLDDVCGEYVGDMLARNTTLLRLSLEGNDLGAKSAAHIGRALEVNHTLQHLSLESNPLGRDGQQARTGLEALARGLARNRALRAAFLFRTELGAQGAHTVVQALEDNHTLTVLDLGATGVTTRDQEALDAKLSANRELFDAHLRERRAERRKLRSEEQARREEEEAERKRQEEEDWLEEQRRKRTEGEYGLVARGGGARTHPRPPLVRRLAAAARAKAKEDERRRKEEERKRREEEEKKRREEEERRAEEEKNKKKKKGVVASRPRVGADRARP